MELVDLVVFRTVVREGGVTRAAARLHRVQSNVTVRVRKLEESLGVELFERDGRGLRLTSAGRTLVDYADRMLALADETRDALRDDRPRGTLRLGAMESTAAVRLPSPLFTFHRRHPHVAVEIATGPVAEMLAGVVDGRLDAAFVPDPLDDARVVATPVFDEELVLVAPASHKRVARPQDVTPASLLAFHPGCPHRARLERWFASAGVVPERIVELASYHAMLGCIAAGMGVALMPRIVLGGYAERRRLSIHRLPRGFNRYSVLLVRRRGRPSAALSAFIDVLPASSSSSTQVSATRSRPKA